MHHYRSREDETSCGGGASDPYFYLRLSTGSASPYCGNQAAAIKLEVDVNPEPRMTPVPPVTGLDTSSPSEDAAAMDAVGIAVCKEEEPTHQLHRHHHNHHHHHHSDGTTTAAGIGLLALTQLDGYGGGGYVKSVFCDTPDEDRHQHIVTATPPALHHHIPSSSSSSAAVAAATAAAVDLLHRDKDDKYLFGRQLMYPSPDDIKHQVYS